jgi:hypothetical protein
MSWGQKTSPSPADIGADVAGAAAAAQAASQPVDADLTAIAALTTTAYGRAFNTLADAPALAASLGWMWLSPPPTQDVFQPAIASDSSGNASTSGVLHATYLGYTTQPTLIKHVRCYMTAVSGAANQIMEIGLFSTPLSPQAAGQTLTCLAVAADTGVPTNITTCLAGAGVKTNITDFANVIPAGTHVWAGMRTAFTAGAGTQPTWRRAFPVGDGQVLWVAASGVISLAGTYVGAVAAIGTQPPFIYATRW